LKTGTNTSATAGREYLAIGINLRELGTMANGVPGWLEAMRDIDGTNWAPGQTASCLTVMHGAVFFVVIYHSLKDRMTFLKCHTVS
jgi:hypothetical protein